MQGVGLFTVLVTETSLQIVTGIGFDCTLSPQERVDETVYDPVFVTVIVFDVCPARTTPLRYH
jgi:hypothetical protein